MHLERYENAAERAACEYLDMMREEEFEAIVEALDIQSAHTLNEFYQKHFFAVQALVETTAQKRQNKLEELDLQSRFLTIAACAKFCFAASAVLKAANAHHAKSRSERKTLLTALEIANAHHNDEWFLWPFPCDLPDP